MSFPKRFFDKDIIGGLIEVLSSLSDSSAGMFVLIIPNHVHTYIRMLQVIVLYCMSLYFDGLGIVLYRILVHILDPKWADDRRLEKHLRYTHMCEFMYIFNPMSCVLKRFAVLVFRILL